MKEVVSKQSQEVDKMKAEDPRRRTGSKEPSETAAAEPAEIAAAIARPSSSGKVRASRRTPEAERKASLASEREE